MNLRLRSLFVKLSCLVQFLMGVEWVHCLFSFPLILGKLWLSHAKLGHFCVVKIIYFRKTYLFSSSVSQKSLPGSMKSYVNSVEKSTVFFVNGKNLKNQVITQSTK